MRGLVEKCKIASVSNFFLNLLNVISKPFMGKGIDKKHPILIKIHSFIYSKLQNNKIKIVKIPLNSRLKVYSKDTYLGLFLSVKKSYEPIQTKLLLEELKEGNNFFDVGANVGYYSVLASKKVGASGKVFSFEPDKENLALLHENVMLNELNNIKVFDLALGITEGLIDFKSSKNHKGISAVTVSEEERGDYKVNITTLDSFVLQNSITNIDFIKIDVEGYEMNVLNGGKNVLSNSVNTKMFVELNPQSLRKVGHTCAELIGLIESLGFNVVSILDDVGLKTVPYSEENLSAVLKYSAFTNLYCQKHAI